MNIFFKSFLFAFFIVTNSFSQSKVFFRIYGKVIDSSTSNPLYGVNLFLANTTLGSSTDKNGLFTIDRVPIGSYNMIITMMGYESISFEIQNFSENDINKNIFMKLTALLGDTVHVSAPYPYEWLKNFEIFKPKFLGIRYFAEKFKLFNYEFLNFNYDKTRNLFSANTSQPLIIENQALGYRIKYYLKEFWFTNETTVNLGYIGFTPLVPKNENQQKEWEKNRFDTYLGSKQHFFRTLFSKQWKKEGFKIDISPSGKPLDERKADIDTMLSAGDRSSEMRLTFPGYLKVIYTKKKDEYTYAVLTALNEKIIVDEESRKIADRNNLKQCSEQISTLKVLFENYILFNEYGLVLNPSNVSTWGYWAYERISDWLPLDYSPGTE